MARVSKGKNANMENVLNTIKRTTKTKRSKATKLQPAQRYLRYEVTNSGSVNTETSHFIDLARDISRLNRRLYRQGRCYHVKRVSIVSSNTIAGTPTPSDTINAGKISFSTIPETWVSAGAWKRAFQLWQKGNLEAMRAIGNDIAGTYSDFKVYMSNDHRGGTVLQPLDNGGNAYLGGEWEYSVLVSPDGTTSADPFYLQMLGNHNGSAGAWNAVGVIKSYGESRTTVNSGDPNVPSTVSDDPLANMFDDGTVTDERLNYLEAENDNPPYDILSYPGDDTNGPKPAVVQQTTLGADGRASVGGFKVMCGLIEIEASSPIASDVYSVLVELAPGKYRGIAADVI